MRTFETTRRHCRSDEALVRWKIIKWKIGPGYCGCGDELEG